MNGLGELKRTRDSYSADDLTEGRRLVPIRLSDLAALIEIAEVAARIDHTDALQHYPMLQEPLAIALAKVKS